MQVILEGNTSILSISNIGDLEEFDFNIDDINEEADLNEIYEQINSYYESSELDLATDTLKYRVINPEDINYLAIKDNEDEKEISLDDTILEHKSIDSISKFLDNANIGDLIYLRKEEGRVSIEYSLEEIDKLTFEYFDCLGELDQSDLLAESYYDIICDSIDLDKIKSKNEQAQIDRFDFEPDLIYGEFYRVLYDAENDEKRLEKIDIPGYYFLDSSVNSDELLN